MNGDLVRCDRAIVERDLDDAPHEQDGGVSQPDDEPLAGLADRLARPSGPRGVVERGPDRELLAGIVPGEVGIVHLADQPLVRGASAGASLGSASR